MDLVTIKSFSINNIKWLIVANLLNARYNTGINAQQTETE